MRFGCLLFWPAGAPYTKYVFWSALVTFMGLDKVSAESGSAGAVCLVACCVAVAAGVGDGAVIVDPVSALGLFVSITRQAAKPMIVATATSSVIAAKCAKPRCVFIVVIISKVLMLMKRDLTQALLTFWRWQLSFVRQDCYTINV